MGDDSQRQTSLPLMAHHLATSGDIIMSTFYCLVGKSFYRLLFPKKTILEAFIISDASSEAGLLLFTSVVDMQGQGFPDSSVGKESACNTGDPSSIPGLGRSAGEGIGYPLQYSWASPVAQLVKNLPAMRET